MTVPEHFDSVNITKGLASVDIALPCLVYLCLCTILIHQPQTLHLRVVNSVSIAVRESRQHISFLSKVLEWIS